MASPQAAPTSLSSAIKQPALPTFMDHVQELRNRLFWIALVFIVASAAAYPFRDVIIALLTGPLKGQELYYLTPAGGFSFIIKICTYAGAILTLPAIIYHLYAYLRPLVNGVKRRGIMLYVFFSTLLAAAGVGFAYFISLPAALGFLTGFDLKDVTAMLTVDSYFSFVITYLLGAAILFQLPLVMMIINSIKPQSPGGLMKKQRYVILGAFVIAAIISPTPDATNQALLAGPIILMYQLGVFLVMIQNSMKKRKLRRREQLIERVTATEERTQRQPIPAAARPQPKLAQQVATPTIVAKKPPTPRYSPRPTNPPVSRPKPKFSLDGVSHRVNTPLLANRPQLRANMNVIERQTPTRPVPSLPGRSIDGFALSMR